MARWGLNEGTGTTAGSSIGSFPGTLTNGPVWVTPGSTFNAVPDTTPPAAPGGLAATPGNTSVGLSWTANSEVDLAGYNIYRSTTAGVSLTSPINGGTLVTGTTYTDTGRTNGQIYYYVLTAVDRNGYQSGASNEVNATPQGVPPAAPTGLGVAASGPAHLTLTWTDNSADETGFEIERSTTGIGGSYSLLTTTAANAVTYINSGLASATPYCYRVRAVNATGQSTYTSNVCATTLTEGSSALLFDGTDDLVTFGAVPDLTGLGVKTFTIETWLKKTGAGLTTSTGTGGLAAAVPLVTKGRGEGDNSNVDMNYFFGINSTGVLAADFEECATSQVGCPATATNTDGDGGGQNYPVYGTTVLQNNVWYHAAVTFDGRYWRLYLNGVQDGINDTGTSRLPRWDSIQHAGLGTAMTSSGASARAGAFAGILDEVRIWNTARTMEQIRADINSQLTSGTGLVARWGLSEGGTATTTYSSVGTFPGTLTNGPTWTTPGALFNISFDTTPPAAPTGLTAIGANASIALDWVDNVESDLAGYNVYRSPTVGGPYTKVNTTLVTLSNYSDLGLVNGTEYYYVVRAVDTSTNESLNSNESYAIPQVEAGSALQFTTNTGTYVTFGDPEKLDLATFTIETWFKRTGTGTSVTTGTGGISNAIPLVTHGAQQAEGSNVDANWVLVIDDATDVIAADFEDMALGTNHPILGVTPITDNVWHHAAATYDGTTWKLYLDGKLENSLAVGQTPRSDSTQHASLGSMLNTTGGTNGFFQGVLDEARVWDRALSQTEILSGINHPLTSGTGLVARWGLNEGTGTVVVDSIATAANGTITGPNYAWVPGAPFDLNLTPATPTLVTPANGATGVPTSTALTVTVDDARDAPLTVSFYGRVKGGATGADFTLIAIPDPQYYASLYPSIYNSQMNWVVSNKVSSNIKFVMSLGDNVDDRLVPAQWTNATTAWDILTTGGVPYGLVAGNHDGAPSPTTEFNAAFASRLAAAPNNCVRYGTTDFDNHYCLFAANGLNFIAVFLENDAGMTSASDARLVWANSVLGSYPTRRAIVATHNLLNGDVFTGQGQAIYDKLKGNANLFLMLGGHADTSARRTDIYEGHTVYSLRSDYQAVDSYQSGYLRIMRFSPANSLIYVTTYSTNQEIYRTGGEDQFNLPYEMVGEAPYTLINSTTVAAGANASVTWSGLNSGTEYEWYAVSDNGGGAASSATWSFTSAGRR